uniref:Uncharacterized protein n=1 Tax=Rhizophora mucronata TaxID=61149 RepID=A0A2P2LJ06_RHIMU
MRRSSSQLEKKRKRAKVIEKGIIWHQKATKCTELIEPTMLGNAYLDGIYWAISFASSLPKHCPWFTTTHNWLVKSSCKHKSCKVKRVEVSKIENSTEHHIQNVVLNFTNM